MSKIFNNLQQFYKRISPGVAGVVSFGAGYAMSDTFTEAPRGQMTVSQRSEWERLLNETARRRRLNRLRKSDPSNTSLLKRLAVPPRQGLTWDPVKHRWTTPEKVGRTVTEVQGKKRIRGTGTGVHERSIAAGGVGGKGAGSAQAGRRFRSAADVVVSRPGSAQHASVRHLQAHKNGDSDRNRRLKAIESRIHSTRN